jgi:hypothetical protein
MSVNQCGILIRYKSNARVPVFSKKTGSAEALSRASGSPRVKIGCDSVDKVQPVIEIQAKTL